ncbi:MAG: DMT family transporter [Cyanobacteria bacterium J06643_4]
MYFFELDALTGGFTGEAAALLAAFLWAAATLMFGQIGKSLSPLVLNVVKGVFAIALLAFTLLLQETLRPATAETAQLPLRATFYLSLSGALGIGLGDTAYFAAINALGARRALLLETLAPPIAAILAWIFLAEQLSVASVFGIVVTLGGIAWVISERVPGSSSDHTNSTQNTTAGVKIAVLATFCQASGAVLSRAALAETTMSPLWSSLIRLSAGLICLVWWAVLNPNVLEGRRSHTLANKAAETTRPKTTFIKGIQENTKHLKSLRLLVAVGIAAFFGTYLGIWLQQVSLKYTATGIAQALLATSPLFVLPMAALLGERFSLRAILGAAIALGGVWLLLFAG